VALWCQGPARPLDPPCGQCAGCLARQQQHVSQDCRLSRRTIISWARRRLSEHTTHRSIPRFVISTQPATLTSASVNRAMNQRNKSWEKLLSIRITTHLSNASAFGGDIMLFHNTFLFTVPLTCASLPVSFHPPQTSYSSQFLYLTNPVFDTFRPPCTTNRREVTYDKQGTGALLMQEMRYVGRTAAGPSQRCVLWGIESSVTRPLPPCPPSPPWNLPCLPIKYGS